MRIEINIPEEFEKDYTADKFAEFLGRVRADIDYNGMCGNYERETADVLAEAFKNSRVVQTVAHKGGRLIDVDELIKITRKDRDYAEKNGFMDMFYERQHLINVISKQPAVYDLNEVVKQLNNKAENHGGEDYYIEIGNAIDIVKSGGIE